MLIFNPILQAFEEYIATKTVPFCCKEEAKWIDNGPRLQYYYCRLCKNEVLSPEQVTLEDRWND